MENFSSAKALVEALKPQEPVSCLRPHASYAAGNYFLRNFCGKTLYAVKTNPHPCILRALRKSGITRFDVASLNEIALLNRYIPDLEINFLHRSKIKSLFQKPIMTTMSERLLSIAYQKCKKFLTPPTDQMN